ncbi:MAG: hypothetical protein QGH37_28305 [Candidatus Poribacteria bacterium]|nr:hypothetical protein [Candidatus Poribacteria bacterium]
MSELQFSYPITELPFHLCLTVNTVKATAIINTIAMSICFSKSLHCAHQGSNWILTHTETYCHRTYYIIRRVEDAEGHAQVNRITAPTVLPKRNHHPLPQ